MRSISWRLSIIPALLLALSPALSSAQLSVSISIAPPELPVYEQPPIPGDGYLWVPGYWAWGDDIQDYYWIPGTWVEAPQPDYLWTPGYWAAVGAIFIWHAGYWGPQVGFYGGVNYGYGYGGRGYEGGYWQGGHLFYNRSVVNIGSTHITNVYNKTVVNNYSETRVSYNGGSRGARAQPTAAEMAATHERHIEATPVQREHMQTARSSPDLRASVNRGRPPIAATPRAGNFSNPIPARNAPIEAGRGNPAERQISTERQTPASRQTPGERQTPVSRQTLQPSPGTVRPVQPSREGAAPQERASPLQHANPPREIAPLRQPPPQQREAPPLRQPQQQQREAPPPRQAPPPREAPLPRQAAPVEPRGEPAQTQARPAPQPQARPAPRPAEHPQEHDHH